jgi:ATPase subunit of ABC transporter with duplicated ATPase domains
MTVLKISNLTYSYNDKVLFNNINFTLTSGQKVALVGQNGSGKSTLLDLIWGNGGSTPSPSATPLKRGISITESAGYVSQNLGLRPDVSILEYLMEQSLDWVEVWEVLESSFGFENELETKLADLSHGEYLKLKLALTLSKNPDLLLLDEPTNNLDRDSILALGVILKEYRGTVLVVSHDPVFLDLFVTQVLDLSNGKIEIFGGNYEFYGQQKKLTIARQNEMYNHSKRELKQALQAQKEAQINAEHRLIKGKKDAQKSNLGKAEQNFFKNKSELKSGQNKNKFDRIILAKEEELSQNRPNIIYPIHFKFNTNQTKNKRLVEITNCELVVGEKVLISDINFEIYSGQKILIEGKNGSGKSSFLKGLVQIHLGENQVILVESGGKILKQVQDDTVGKFYFSKDVKIVYLDQNYSLVNQSLSLEENLKLVDDDISLTDLYKLLAYFQFSKQDGNRSVKTLSGGELVRLNLAILTLQKVDILILDEPTNNLDISTLEVLLRVLEGFQGALILVCHNAWFTSQIDFDNIYRIDRKTLVSII